MRRLLNTIACLAFALSAGCNTAPSTDIWTAARDGNVGLLEQHVAAGTDINGTLDMPGNPADGGSPLHAAVFANQLDAIDFLIAQGAEIDCRDSSETGASPLMWAAAFGNVEAAQRLITAGAAVNYVDNNGATALDATLMFEPNTNRESKAKIAQLLRDKGGQSSLAPVTIGDIWTAAATGNTAAISKHLDDGADVNGLEPTTRATPLLAAVTFGHTAAARLLLERQADLTLTNPDGNTALHLAALFAYPETVRMLLEKGANVAARNSRGQTALDTIAPPWSPAVKGLYDLIATTLRIPMDIQRIKAGRPQVAAILREKIGTASDSDTEATTDIVLAVTKGYVPSVKQYLDNGGNPDRREPLGNSPLLLVACLHGHADVAAALLTAGADVNLQNPDGETPLHVAVLVAYPEVVKVLLKHDADTTLKNNKGQLPNATVETPWQQIKPLYGFLGSILQMKFDTNRIEKERVIVAELLKTHATQKQTDQSPSPAADAP